MKAIFKGLSVLILVAVLVLGWSSVFIIHEGQQAIITQFGRPVGKPVVKAGLHYKIPFIQKVRYLDKRILTWDGDPNQIPTKDKKYIHVDTTARWRIVNPLRFIETVQNIRGAIGRLNDIIDALTRDTISKHYLVEAVRNSNTLFDSQNAAKLLAQEGDITGDIQKISIGRENLSLLIAKEADNEMRQYGISIIDVQLRRISYEKNVENKVYDRMISERQRIAEKIRALGQGERAKIQGRKNRDLQKIESQAYRKAQIIKGRAEAKAIDIYAKSMGKSPDFYEFTRTLDAYKHALKKKTRFIISSEGQFFKLFQGR